MINILKSFVFQVLYVLFNIINKKKLVLFIENKTSADYMNIRVLYNYYLDNKVECLLIDSLNPLKKIFFLSKSKIIFVDQADYVISNIKLHYSVKLVQLWHAGGAYKAFGFDAKRNYISSDKEIKRIRRIHGNYSYVIISDKRLEDILSNAYGVKKSNVLSLGLVRTDLYYNLDLGKERRNKIKKLLNIPLDSMVIGYAPTFRDFRSKRSHSIDYVNDVLYATSRAFKKSITLYKKHPSVGDYCEKINDLIILDKKVSNIDFYLVVDILISDYSSIIFDFAFFKKPIILYLPDFDDYINNNRKLYFNPNEIVKDEMVVYNKNELILALKNPIISENIWGNFMRDCDGYVCKKIFNYFSKY